MSNNNNQTIYFCDTEGCLNCFEFNPIIAAAAKEAITGLKPRFRSEREQSLIRTLLLTERVRELGWEMTGNINAELICPDCLAKLNNKKGTGSEAPKPKPKKLVKYCDSNNCSSKLEYTPINNDLTAFGAALRQTQLGYEAALHHWVLIPDGIFCSPWCAGEHAGGSTIAESLKFKASLSRFAFKHHCDNPRCNNSFEYRRFVPDDTASASHSRIMSELNLEQIGYNLPRVKWYLCAHGLYCCKGCAYSTELNGNSLRSLANVVTLPPTTPTETTIIAKPPATSKNPAPIKARQRNFLAFIPVMAELPALQEIAQKINTTTIGQPLSTIDNTLPPQWICTNVLSVKFYQFGQGQIGLMLLLEAQEPLNNPE